MDPGESVLFHNPRCSKSREACALLQARGVEFREVRYLDTPPDVAQLRELVAMLQLPPRQLLRTGEEAYTSRGLADPSVTDDELLAAMHEHPSLIERPIFVHAGRAVIGRPPERVLELLSG